jgi:hypothetical protein
MQAEAQLMISSLWYSFPALQCGAADRIGIENQTQGEHNSPPQ